MSGNGEPTEILARPASLDEPVTSSLVDDIVTVAERRLQTHTRILGVALQITNATDWVDQQGKPYLTASGAEKIAGLFGIEIPRKDQHGHDLITCEKEWGEDEQGRYYFYTVMGMGRIKGHAITAIGTCSSRDQFFAKSGDEWRPMSEVDETNIKKAAYSNFIVNVITRLLGLRNLTWDQVKAGGIDPEKAGKVRYGIISEKQHNRLMAIASKAKVTTDQIKAHFSLSSTKDIERNKYEEICKWAEGGGQGAAPERQPGDEPHEPNFFETLNPFIAKLGVAKVKATAKQYANTEDLTKITDKQAQADLLDALKELSR